MNAFGHILANIYIPDLWPLIDLGFDRMALIYSYRADTPIPTTFVQIPEQKKSWLHA